MVSGDAPDAIQRDPSSFRDPAGYVVECAGHVLRCIRPPGVAAWRAVSSSGAIDALLRDGLLIGTSEVPLEAHPEIADAAVLLQHERIPFVSYPYEWTFEQLRVAALHHIRVHRVALSRGATLVDASAYNVQFRGANPVFIDALSVVPYEPGSYWLGYSQFCRHFLYPLVLTSTLGVPTNDWLRSALDGICAHDAARMMPWQQKLRPGFFMHVAMAARAERYVQDHEDRSIERLKAAKKRALPLSAVLGLLSSLERIIERLKPAGRGLGVWATYADHNTYGSAERDAKHRFLAEAVARHRPRMALDLGCNTGDYSQTMLGAGAAYVVGVDGDHSALGRAFARSGQEKLDFLPLVMDLSNPSPGQGWRGRERKSFESRCAFDFVAALALVHHLAIARNIPLGDVIAWIVSLAPAGVIEWVEKGDQTIQRMLVARRDHFDDYTVESFRAALGRHAAIVDEAPVSREGRRLFHFVRAT